MSSDPKFHVGQTVILRNVNERRMGGISRGEVVKVGRKLVHVADERYRWTEVYRIDTGRKNDNYGHAWIQTEEEFAQEDERRTATERITATGIRLDTSRRRLSTTALNAIAAIIEGDA